MRRLKRIYLCSRRMMLIDVYEPVRPQTRQTSSGMRYGKGLREPHGPPLSSQLHGWQDPCPLHLSVSPVTDPLPVILSSLRPLYGARDKCRGRFGDCVDLLRVNRKLEIAKRGFGRFRIGRYRIFTRRIPILVSEADRRRLHRVRQMRSIHLPLSRQGDSECSR